MPASHKIQTFAFSTTTFQFPSLLFLSSPYPLCLVSHQSLMLIYRQLFKSKEPPPLTHFSSIPFTSHWGAESLISNRQTPKEASPSWRTAGCFPIRKICSSASWAHRVQLPHREKKTHTHKYFTRQFLTLGALKWFTERQKNSPHQSRGKYFCT